MGDERLHVVVRIGWRVVSLAETYTQFWPDFHELSRADNRRFVPVAAFATREAAEARMGELELEAARLFNPFEVGPRSALTEQPETLLSRLAALVGTLPQDAVTNAATNHFTWREWWDEYAPGWSDELLRKVWDQFDQIRFYAILEIEAGDE